MIFNGLVIIVALSFLTAVLVEGELLTIGALSGIAAVASYYGYDRYVQCTFQECCIDKYVHPDVDKLDELLRNVLYGQQLARRTIVSALRGHIASDNPPKALSLSFHGPPGTGKTFVTRLIAKAFFERGMESHYYHFFNGRNDFPLKSKVDEYKVTLHNAIVNGLNKCERSIFVFDEVDKMPEGLLDVLVPSLDYTPSYKLKSGWITTQVNKTKAIYIFLSNTGSSKIVRHMINFWEQGRRREELRMDDFENIISVGAFNEKGGFHYSDTIQASLIDHYVPFLPLEEAQVKKCLVDAFRVRNIEPTAAMIEEGMKYVTFGPNPHNLYSNSGCKRLEQKAASIAAAHRKG